MSFQLPSPLCLISFTLFSSLFLFQSLQYHRFPFYQYFHLPVHALTTAGPLFFFAASLYPFSHRFLTLLFVLRSILPLQAWLCNWCFGQSRQFDPVLLDEMPSVELDAAGMGQDVVIVKGGRRICGSGGALANTPVAQDKAYFEVKVQASGAWGVGLASPQVSGIFTHR